MIAKAGRPLAKLVPVNRHEPPPRRLGAWKGRLWLAEDWDPDDVNDQIARGFHGSEIFPDEAGG